MNRHKASSRQRYSKAGYAVPARRKRLLMAVGMLMVTAGAALAVNQLYSRAARAWDEAALRHVYYAAGTGSVLPAATPEPAPVPAAAVSIHDTATAVPARTFATAVPWANLITRDKFLPLRKVNRDIAGWLTIEGMLDLPVVQRDNIYYLNHDFRNASSTSGTLFLDEGFSIIPPCENLLIHGHNMRDGSMFGKLHQYKDRAFYAAHCIIHLETLYDAGDYAVFAAFTMNSDSSNPDYLPFAYARFGSDRWLNEYVAAIKTRSYFPCGLEVIPTDQLLTLSTCAGDNTWFVVVARRVRADENISNVTLTCIMTSYK